MFFRKKPVSRRRPRASREETKERVQDSNAPTTLPLPEGERTSDIIARIDPYIAIATKNR